jgi:hypothetical protein
MISYHTVITRCGRIVTDSHEDTLTDANFLAAEEALNGDLVTIMLAYQCLDGFEDQEVLMEYVMRD